MPTATEMVKTLARDQETVAGTARAVFPIAEKAGDQGTADLVTKRLLVHEKAAWMLRSQFAE